MKPQPISPTKVFIDWLASVSENPYAQNLCYLIMSHYPDFDTSSIAKPKIDYVEHLIGFVSQYTKPGKIIGLALYIDAAVSFTLLDYDNVDKMLDDISMNQAIIDEMIEKGEDPSTFVRMKKDAPEKHQQRKELKESWDYFRETLFTREFMSLYHTSSFRSLR